MCCTQKYASILCVRQQSETVEGVRLTGWPILPSKHISHPGDFESPIEVSKETIPLVINRPSHCQCKVHISGARQGLV